MPSATSAHTVDSYRHTFRLLLTYASEQGKPPSQLGFDDVGAALVSAFLDYLEHDRSCGTGTRNTRLAAIHSFFRFSSYRHPEHAATIQQVLAIPQKKAERRPRCFLTRAEMQALLAAPDRSTWIGRRDHALLALALQTGLRLSELTGLRCRTSSSAPERTSSASGKDESAATPRSTRRQSRSCAPGSGNEKESPAIRCSPRARAAG